MKQVKKSKVALVSLLLLFITFLSSCNNKRVDEQTAVRIYIESMIAEEKYSNNLDSLNIKRLEIFQKYNTTQTDFENFFHSLKDDNKKWESFFKKADEYLTEFKKSNVIN